MKEQYMPPVQAYKNTFTNEQRKMLRKALRWSLQTASYVPNGNKIKGWFARKMEGMASFGIADRDELPKRALEATRLYFDMGIPSEQIALRLKISPRQVQREINEVLDYVLDNAPSTSLAVLEPMAFTIQTGACSHCGYDLYWDPMGAYGMGGDWCCILCARRYDVNFNPRRVCDIT